MSEISCNQHIDDLIALTHQRLARSLGSDLLRERSVLHADETPVTQLDPGTGKTKKAYLWAYRTNNLDLGPPILAFDYQPGRHGVHVHNYLEGWQGHLMVDERVVYNCDRPIRAPNWMPCGRG